MSRSAAPGATPPAPPGMPPEGVLAVVCLDNPRDNTRGKALWTSLPSLGPQEKCPWRLSDVIPARMVSHTLRTWTCSHLTWRGQSSRPPAVSPTRSPNGRFSDWHNAPRRQYAIFLSGGQMEVVIGDGTTRRFGPGDAVLFEDLTGQGHTSRSVGGDRLTAIVPLAD